MTEKTVSMGSTTFWDLLGAPCIVIPDIQRDYAQGRDTTQAKDIRTAFATALDTAFREAKPLSLDFVYLVNNDEGKRIPVDGQQRLTTLCLFHLYHLPLTEEAGNRLGRFTYEVRESATAFCAELVRSRKAWREAVQDGKTPQEAIRDQPWFLAAWERDPTVMGMLRMLDAIHEACKEKGPLPDNWWEGKSVTFLPFTEAADPDEVYRKLNARGKPLTPFENLKAYIDGKQVPDWANKIDAEWLDAIWALYPPLRHSAPFGDPRPASDAPCRDRRRGKRESAGPPRTGRFQCPQRGKGDTPHLRTRTPLPEWRRHVETISGRRLHACDQHRRHHRLDDRPMGRKALSARR